MKYRGNHAGCHGGSILLGVAIGWTILLAGFPLPVARSQPPAPAQPGREKPPVTVQSADPSGTQKTRLLDMIDSGQAKERASFQTTPSPAPTTSTATARPSWSSVPITSENTWTPHFMHNRA